MSLENLWAPWRLSYVTGEKPVEAPRPRNWLPGADQECFLCRGVAEGQTADRDNLIVARGERSLVVINRFPYNNGHLLVAPQQHLAELGDLNDDVQMELQHDLQRMITHLRKLMNPQGFNIGLNLGRAAGAGVPGHLHWHIVPRWQGDTNFMPATAGARVIPQALDALWELLTAEIKQSRAAQ